MPLPFWLQLRQHRAQRQAAKLIERLRRRPDAPEALARACSLRLMAIDPRRFLAPLDNALGAALWRSPELLTLIAQRCRGDAFSQDARGAAWALALASRPAPFPEGSLGRALAAACESARAERLAELALRSASSGCSPAS